MRPQLDSCEVSVIVLGSFNPPIFQPAWFAEHEFFSEEDRVEAEAHLGLIHPELASFQTDWLAFTVERERCQFRTAKAALHSSLRDLVVAVFTLLAETPVKAFGMNRNAHYAVETRADMDAIGNELAPKEPWDGVLTHPGLLHLVMEELREEYAGYLRVEVGPSARLAPAAGVYVAMNDHYDVLEETKNQDATEMTQLLLERWDASQSRAQSMFEKVLNGAPS